MAKAMRQSTLETMGLGTVHDIFRKGELPASAGTLVDKVFGAGNKRGSLVISGANGIVGAGKTMQLGSRLEPYGVRIVALDFPNAPDGIGKQYPGLVRAFGREGADRIMGKVIRLTYDGTNLPALLKELNPKFLLEAIPEILSVKKAHYKVFRDSFPGIEIRSVTSGFPSSELGVGIAHPAFPHEINKVFEIVEREPSAVTQLFWALGLIPLTVGDYWSFILDVLFCGITLAGTRYHHAANMPYWKIDKYARRLLGPNPFRAHDAIGAAGANFLTWSCLHHLGEKYGEVFKPTAELTTQKDSGANWYPLDHFRPLVNWSLDAKEEEDFQSFMVGPLIQMTSLLLHEKRGHLTHINSIGEMCAQFRKGMLAYIRGLGAEAAVKRVKAYHKLHPAAAKGCWYPAVFEDIGKPEWQQLYVNAEHDGKVGVISIARESYNSDVDAELNRAVDWLKAAKVDRVIVTGDFHLATQMVGADTSEFFPALENEGRGVEIASSWARTARRLASDFKESVGFVHGKRCLGGFLELLLHCHHVVAVTGSDLGMPEVTLPVVPGMEGCHWPFRKATAQQWPKLIQLLLSGRFTKAEEAKGWLIDYAGPIEDAIKVVWKTATGAEGGLPLRKLNEGALKGVPKDAAGLPATGDPAIETARKAIMDCIQQSTAATLADALSIQAKHSGGFMRSDTCKKGRIGAEFTKAMTV